MHTDQHLGRAAAPLTPVGIAFADRAFWPRDTAVRGLPADALAVLGHPLSPGTWDPDRRWTPSPPTPVTCAVTGDG
ncbi:hypothetical protein ACIQUQ_30305 [Streptomyces sp. NPDC101118]|uniref:hypothetical protein n=1 Tax=Streptomyces sp. NPDC101118 TaxID=3366109 RepID=UPI003804B3E1